MKQNAHKKTKETTMKYRLNMSRYGIEVNAGLIPERIVKYIQDECGSDADEFSARMWNGKVPDCYGVGDGKILYADATRESTIFFANGPTPTSDNVLEITDEDKNVVLRRTLDLLPNTVACLDADVLSVPSKLTGIKSAYTNATNACMCASVEMLKGYWEAEITTDTPFDEAKLNFNLKKLTLPNTYLLVIDSFEYDDVQHVFVPMVNHKMLDFLFG